MKLKNSWLLAIIIFFAVFLRFYHLDSVPPALYQDETSIGYSAYSILLTGRDEYGKSFPLYFKSFGDWKLPVYIYSTVPSVGLFGLTPFAVRFPSALFGVLSVLALYFFTRDLTKNKNLALISSFLLAVNPWSLHYNRATFEVSIALFFFIFGAFLLNKFFSSKTKGAFLGGVLCFIIALYSYNLTRLLAPFLFALLIYNNKSEIRRTSKKEVALSGAVSAIFLSPFVFTFFTGGGISSASGTLITTSAVVQAPLQEFRAYMISLPHVLSSLFFNIFFLNIWQYLNNIASYFSVSFFFISGSAHGNHGIGNFGLFYLFELPFILFGLVQMIREKITGTFFLISWAVLVILIASLTREVPHATRSFFLLVPLVIFIAVGVLSFYKLAKTITNGMLRKIIFAVVFLFVTYNMVFYFASYYLRFPVLYAKAWRLHDRELSRFLAENDAKYEKIIIDENSGFIYTSLLFYSKYPPEQFQKSVKRLPDDAEGFSKVRSFGKYEFRSINWEEDMESGSALLITSGEQKPSDKPILKVIDYPQRPSYFPADQKIHKLLLRDEAYVLVEAK